MARRVPGMATSFSFISTLDVDVERMNKPALRLYLRRRLRNLEARIRLLSSKYNITSADDLDSLVWGDARSIEMWESLLQLDYLEAMRDAVLETLAAL